MHKTIVLILGVLFLLGGCMEIEQEIVGEKEIYTVEDLINILEQNNPELCLRFSDKEVNGSFVKDYLHNVDVQETFLFKDVCLIHTISFKEVIDANTIIAPNVNDEFIVLCNEASERNYTFLEEGSYKIPGWEFCFRKAFSEYRSYPQPPNLGEIKDKHTCLSLKGFQDNCLWLVAKNGDVSACNMMNSNQNQENCVEKFFED
ncbi:MAG: hypothetical protein ACMXYE_02675 [Candidatus Woesearchaeota archaeon]